MNDDVIVPNEIALSFSHYGGGGNLTCAYVLILEFPYIHRTPFF